MTLNTNNNAGGESSVDGSDDQALKLLINYFV